MLAIMRLRLKVPGHGAKLARLCGLTMVSQNGNMTTDNKSAPITKYEPKPGDILFNYGVAHTTKFIESVQDEVTIINHPTNTELAADKIDTLDTLRFYRIPCVEWTDSKANAIQWTKEGHRVFCRTLTRSKKGKGIVIASTPEEVVDAKLYTKEFKKTHEYRVFVWNGECVDWVQKKRSERLSKTGTVDDSIRNRGRGWVFSHHNRLGHKRIRELGVDAAKALWLDYAAVDILAIWGEKDGKRVLEDCRVCEVNTAPGFSSPTTLKIFVDKINQLKERIRLSLRSDA